MQLGFVSAILGDLSLDEVLATAANIGYQCVEVMCWPEAKEDRPYGGVCHIDVTDFTQAKADDIRALCDKHGMHISALGYYANSLSDDANEAQVARNHLHKLIDAAPLLGLKNVNAFIGANRYKPLGENLKQFTEVWPDIIRHAEDRGVKIGIENCPMLVPETWPFGVNLARTPAIWRRMFEAIPSPNFGLNYDPSHLVMQLMDPIAPIREFGADFSHTRQRHAGRPPPPQRYRLTRAAYAAEHGQNPRSGRRPMGPLGRCPHRRRLQWPRMRGSRGRSLPRHARRPKTLVTNQP